MKEEHLKMKKKDFNKLSDIINQKNKVLKSPECKAFLVNLQRRNSFVDSQVSKLLNPLLDDRTVTGLLRRNSFVDSEVTKLLNPLLDDRTVTGLLRRNSFVDSQVNQILTNNRELKKILFSEATARKTRKILKKNKISIFNEIEKRTSISPLLNIKKNEYKILNNKYYKSFFDSKSSFNKNDRKKFIKLLSEVQKNENDVIEEEISSMLPDSNSNANEQIKSLTAKLTCFFYKILNTDIGQNLRKDSDNFMDMFLKLGGTYSLIQSISKEELAILFFISIIFNFLNKKK